MSEKHYSEEGFWDKLTRFARVAGREVVEKALWLFYALQQPRLPVWARTVIMGALGYFIFPADAIPDVVPLAGYSDDLGALAAAVGMVAMYIDDSVRARADETLRRWFGE